MVILFMVASGVRPVFMIRHIIGGIRYGSRKMIRKGAAEGGWEEEKREEGGDQAYYVWTAHSEGLLSGFESPCQLPPSL